MASGPRWQPTWRADRLKVRRGTEATWQSPSGPRGARVALTRGRVPRGQATRMPVRGATWREAGKWRAHELVGPG